MDYFLSEGVYNRKLDEDYLLFSELSKETLLVHPFTFELFKLLKMDKGLNKQSLQRQLVNQSIEVTTEFIDDSLNQLVALGFVSSY